MLLSQAEIEAEIIKLQKQLNDCKLKQKKAKMEMDELEDIIAKLRSKAREIEQGLQETINNIERKLQHINEKSKFKSRYLNSAKSIILNSNSSIALQSTREAEKKAVAKYWDLDDTISEYQTEILMLENQISAFKQQLK